MANTRGDDRCPRSRSQITALSESGCDTMAMAVADRVASHRRTPPDWFGPWLATRRRRIGWSFRVAEQRTGVSAGHLCKLEKGQRCPSATVANAIADAYRMSENDRERLLSVAVWDAGRDFTLDGYIARKKTRPVDCESGASAPTCGDGHCGHKVGTQGAMTSSSSRAGLLPID